MIINSELLDGLTMQAKSSPRLRQMYDLRNSPEDNSQRFLNALEPETFLPIHKHPMCNTVIIVLRGAVHHYIYDDEGNIIEEAELRAQNGLQPLFQIEKNKWHNLKCLESGTVIFEHKDAKYDSNTDSIRFDK